MNPKLKDIISTMEQHGWDTVLLTDPKHIYYLTGYASDPHERFLGLVLQQSCEPFLLLPALDADVAAAASGGICILTHRDTDQPYDILKSRLQSPVGVLALEKSHMTLSRFEQLQETLSAHHYADIGPLLQDMRAVKSPHEISTMKEAVRIVEQVLTEGLRSVRPGVREMELVAELEYLMKKSGAQAPSFDTMVLTGSHTALPHGVPGMREIQEGDLLMFDLGVYYGGYASDITRTFAVGHLSAEARHIYDTVLAANLSAIAAVKPGVSYGSIDQAARSLIEQAGYGEAFLHRLGHGLGLDVHEAPFIHGLNNDLLQPGAVFTIEPGVYIPGIGGVRIEDDVWVTEQGVEILTTFPKELTVLG
ncbi:M24 family metallopeptidase [Paenibacillus sp. JSM ZJ436]|uniref:M24 family metallopeptidase n=1 Tax=Paenibacillus sp. JSM ZJ436 TaxID=3376190 RepID=UPI0037AE49E1